MTITRALVSSVYVTAILVGFFGVAFSLYYLLDYTARARSLGLFLLMLPFVLTNALYLFLVLRILWKNSWRARMYKPFVWLPILLGIPGIFVITGLMFLAAFSAIMAGVI